MRHDFFLSNEERDSAIIITPDWLNEKIANRLAILGSGFFLQRKWGRLGRYVVATQPTPANSILLS